MISLPPRPRYGPALVRELAWRRTRSLAVGDNYTQHGAQGIGPLSRAVFQGFASGVAFSDDSRFFFGQTQEGGSGTIQVPLAGLPARVLTGYRVNNEVYMNLRPLAQRKGVLVSSSSTGPRLCRAFDAVTMDTLPGWASSVPTLPGYSRICDTDGEWGLFICDLNPGQLVCLEVADPTRRLVWTAPDDWSSGVYSLALDPGRRRLAITANIGTVYLLDLAPLDGGEPPILISALRGAGYAATLDPATERLYALDPGRPYELATYDVSRPEHPVRLGGNATHVGAQQAGNGYGSIVLDAARGLLYLAWPRTQNLRDGGFDVVRIDPSTDELELAGTLPRYEQGGRVYVPDYAAISPDGRWYGFGSGGAGAPGGFVLYDVAEVRHGGAGRVASEIPANAEPRGAMMNDDDEEPFIYTGSRYSLSSSRGDGTLHRVVTPGFVTGNQILPFGTSARGTVPGVYLHPGQGFQDVVLEAAQGELRIARDLGNSTFFAGAWDGRHLVTLRKSSDYYNAEVAVYEVGDDYALSPARASIRLPHDRPFTHGAITCDGTFGTTGARIWVAGDPFGVVTIDAESAQGLAVAARDPVFHPIATPIVTAHEGGHPHNEHLLVRFCAYYVDRFGAVLGVSPLSEAIRLTPPDLLAIVALQSPPPPLAQQLNIGGMYSWDGAQWFGPSPVPGAVFLPPDTGEAQITSARTQWSGAVPQTGVMFPSAGHVLSIVVAPEVDRAYVAQGDEGIRVYARRDVRHTAQLAGYAYDRELGIAAPGMAFSRLWHGSTLCSMHYTAQGVGNGIRFHDLTTDPDAPTFQHVPLVAAGFTCTAIDKRKLVLANTIAGPVALTCEIDTWEPCPDARRLIARRLSGGSAPDTRATA